MLIEYLLLLQNLFFCLFHTKKIVFKTKTPTVGNLVFFWNFLFRQLTSLLFGMIKLTSLFISSFLLLTISKFNIEFSGSLINNINFFPAFSFFCVCSIRKYLSNEIRFFFRTVFQKKKIPHIYIYINTLISI